MSTPKIKLIFRQSTVWVTLLFGVFACTPPLSHEEELKLLLSEEHSNTLVQEEAPFKIKLTYLPLRYFELRELQKDKNKEFTKEDEQQIKKECEEKYQGLYFMLEFSAMEKGREAFSHFDFNYANTLEQQLSYGVKQFIFLKTEEGKEIQLAVYEYQNTFGYSPNKTLLLAFPKAIDQEAILENNDQIKIIIREWGLKTGDLIFEYDTDELE